MASAPIPSAAALTTTGRTVLGMVLARIGHHPFLRASVPRTAGLLAPLLSGFLVLGIARWLLCARRRL